MEPITFTATTIATVFFSEAVKEGGKSLGTGVSKMVSQLITAQDLRKQNLSLRPERSVGKQSQSFR